MYFQFCSRCYHAQPFRLERIVIRSVLLLTIVTPTDFESALFLITAAMASLDVEWNAISIILANDHDNENIFGFFILIVGGGIGPGSCMARDADVTHVRGRRT